MPKIPTYGFPDAKSEAANAPALSADVRGAYGEQTAHTLESVGQELQQAHQHAAEQADSLASEQALNQLSDKAIDLQHNPQTGILNGQGQDAFARANAGGGYTTVLSDARDKLADGLTNDRQRQMFIMRSGGLMENVQRSVEEHLGHAFNQEKSDTFQATALGAERELAAAPVGDMQSLERQRARIYSFGKSMGLSPDALNLSLQKFDATASDNWVHRMLDARDFEGANKLLNSPYSKDLLGQDGQPLTFAQVLGSRGDELKKEAAAGDLNFKAGNAANQIVAQSLGPNGRPDEAKAFVAVANMPEGVLKEKTTREVQERLAFASRGFEQQEKDRLGRVITGIEQSDGKLDRSGPDYLTLTDENRAKAEERAKSIARTDRGLQHEDDRIAVNNFKAMPLEDQVKSNPSVDFPGASPVAQSSMAVLKRTAAAQIQKGQAPSMGEFKDYVKSVAEQQGLTGPKKDIAADLVAKMVDWRNAQLEKNSDRPPTRKEVDAQLSQELVVGNHHWYGGDEFRFQAEKRGAGFEVAPAERQTYAPNKAPQTVPSQPKAPRGYKYSKDRSKRIPIYADGSQGAVEAADGQ